MLARLPSAAAYAPQVEKEQRWLPRLAPRLPFAIPTPIAMGLPGGGYPWQWSICGWIDGEEPSATEAIATDVGRFLQALQRVDPNSGPPPGTHNFYRGADLEVYDQDVRFALAQLGEKIDQRAARDRWREALLTRWNRAAIWVHGDVGPANLVARNGRLAAVIDFGNLGVGDPACDVAIAWAWFDAGARAAFRSQLHLDEDTWLRGRAWALWKALVVAAGTSPTNAPEYQNPLRVIRRCLEEC
jgi:aminoglycoside phosphotransferase (APT) family kinase protein